MRRFFCITVLTLLLTACQAQVKHYKPQVVREYPHAVDSYTQGLFFDGGRLFESTGQYGESRFMEIDLETGDALSTVNLSRKYFGEGSVMLDGKLFVLTWTNKVIFVYNAETLEFVQSYSYPREGWGLTTDGKCLIASDGSSRLYFMDSDLKPLRSVNVTLNGRSIRYLNELEWIDGKIWANVYTTDTILIIDPKSGNVEATIDCAGLLPDYLRTRDTDVLNGIAYLDGRIFLTGKNWPRLYEVKLQKN